MRELFAGERLQPSHLRNSFEPPQQNSLSVTLNATVVKRVFDG